jgi:hypothetical protein
LSQSEVTLKMTCANAAAQLAVVDGDFKIVAFGFSPFETKIAPGIYSLQARVGDAIKERIEVLRPETLVHQFQLDAPEFQSAIPILGTSTHHEYQQDTPRRFTNNQPQVVLGQGSAFVLYVRDSSRSNFTDFTQDQRSVYQANFSGFRLLRTDGTELVDFDMAAHKDFDAGYIGALIQIDPGPYVLAWQQRRERWCMPVNAAADFSAQIYLRLQSPSHDDFVMRPDFGGVSYVFDRKYAGFDPMRSDLNALESVRLAFERGRNVVETPIMRMMLSDKFENPMLGLYAAHLLLADANRDQSLLNEVIKNTTRMLGKNFPDCVALAYGYEKLTGKRPDGADDRSWPVLLRELQGPPLLMRSWDLIVACAQATAPGERFPALSVAADLVAGGIYLLWQTRLPRLHTEFESTTVVQPRVAIPKDIDMVLEQRSISSLSFDFAAKTVDRFSSVLQPLGVGVKSARIAAMDIQDANQAATALQTLARKFDWNAKAEKFLGADSNLSRFSGLQRDLVTVLRSTGSDRQILRGLDERFVSALVASNRIPIGTLAEALEGLDEAAAAAP